jgi:hypothetical protein
MQQVKRADAALAVLVVQSEDPLRGTFEQRQPGGRFLRRPRVDAVREERELQLRIGIRQIVELDAPQHRRHVIGMPEQRGHDDQSACLASQPLGEVELRKRARREQPRVDSLDHGQRHHRGGHERDHRRDRHPDQVGVAGTHDVPDARGQREQRDAGQQGERPEIGGRRVTRRHAADAFETRGVVAEAFFERRPPLRHQVVADVAAASVPAGAPSQRHRRFGDVVLGVTRAPRDGLHHLAVRVACLEVHERVHAGRIRAENDLDAVRSFEEALPVEGVEQAQRADRPLYAQAGLQRSVLGG